MQIGAPQSVSPRLRNTAVCGVVALLVAIALGGCGSSSPDVNGLLNDAFHPTAKVSSGRVQFAFGLAGRGLASLSQPESLSLAGPFQSTGAGRLPQFDLSLRQVTNGRTATVGVVSAGGRFFVVIEGSPFVASASDYAALQRGYARSAARATNNGSPVTFASLGIDPSGWLSDPHVAGHAQLDGVDTVHITSGLVVSRFLADLNRISGAGGEFGLSSAGGSGLSAAQIQALGRSIGSARVDVFVGSDDHILRRLSLLAHLTVPPSQQRVLNGLRSGTLSFLLGFSAINEPQAIAAPAHAQPLSALIAGLQELAAGTGTTGASGAGTEATQTTTTASSSAAASSGLGAIAGAAPPAYLHCLQAAGSDLAARARCAPLLNSSG